LEMGADSGCGGGGALAAMFAAYFAVVTWQPCVAFRPDRRT
jgi:hypothetical protein